MQLTHILSNPEGSNLRFVFDLGPTIFVVAKYGVDYERSLTSVKLMSVKVWTADKGRTIQSWRTNVDAKVEWTPFASTARKDIQSCLRVASSLAGC